MVADVGELTVAAATAEAALVVAVQEAADSAAEGMVVRTEAGKAEVRVAAKVAATEAAKVAAREAARAEVGTVGVVRVAVARGVAPEVAKAAEDLGEVRGRKWDRWRR